MQPSNPNLNWFFTNLVNFRFFVLTQICNICTWRLGHSEFYSKTAAFENCTAVTKDGYPYFNTHEVNRALCWLDGQPFRSWINLFKPRSKVNGDYCYNMAVVAVVGNTAVQAQTWAQHTRVTSARVPQCRRWQKRGNYRARHPRHLYSWCCAFVVCQATSL